MSKQNRATWRGVGLVGAVLLAWPGAALAQQPIQRAQKAEPAPDLSGS